jgi:hypothetical protein
VVDAAHADQAKNAVSWWTSFGSVMAPGRRPFSVDGSLKNCWYSFWIWSKAVAWAGLKTSVSALGS